VGGVSRAEQRPEAVEVQGQISIRSGGDKRAIRPPDVEVDRSAPNVYQLPHELGAARVTTRIGAAVEESPEIRPGDGSSDVLALLAVHHTSADVLGVAESLDQVGDQWRRETDASCGVGRRALAKALAAIFRDEGGAVVRDRAHHLGAVHLDVRGLATRRLLFAVAAKPGAPDGNPKGTKVGVRKIPQLRGADIQRTA